MNAKNPVDGLPPIHPGEFLHETLQDLSMTQAAFAQKRSPRDGRVGFALGSSVGANAAVLAQFAVDPSLESGANPNERQLERCASFGAGLNQCLRA